MRLKLAQLIRCHSMIHDMRLKLAQLIQCHSIIGDMRLQYHSLILSAGNFSRWNRTQITLEKKSPMSEEVKMNEKQT